MHRRDFVEQVMGGGATLSLASIALPWERAGQPRAVPESFPRQDLEEVRTVVGASHSDLPTVRRLVDARPELAKAAWDWGFGDWETPLDAASHTGQREIALFLLANGARPTLFSAAMLGQLSVVKGFIEASPGIQRTHGAHSITLLTHARAGGDAARDVLAYLGQVGDADVRTTSIALDAASRAPYVGAYSLGPTASERLEVTDTGTILRIGRVGDSPRNLFPRGAHLFHPAGAPAVRVQFSLNGNAADRVAITDGSLQVTAARTA